MLKIFKTLMIAVCVCSMSASESRADNIYEFLFSQDTYSAAAPGEIVNTIVRLRETATDGDIGRLAVGDRAGGGGDGLFSFALKMDFGTSTGGARSTAGATVVDSAFGESTIIENLANNINVASAESTAAGDLFFGVDGNLIETSGTTTVYEADLFTVAFTAGDVGSVTNLQLSDLVVFENNPLLTPDPNFFADATIIDDTAAYGSSQIVVGASVPEPGSLLALGALMMGGMLRRRRG